jgi:enamine deaminase RidA (YjgF/YER057c/UK114 family)
MTRPEFFLTPGYGQRMLETTHYSQALRIGNRIDLSGQGGWSDDWEFPVALRDEIVQAFDNVERTLNTAGASWKDVVSVMSYHVPGDPDAPGLEPEVTATMVEQFRERMPDRAPLWTGLGVFKLGDPNMRVEIVVTAIVDEDQEQDQR